MMVDQFITIEGERFIADDGLVIFTPSELRKLLKAMKGGKKNGNAKRKE